MLTTRFQMQVLTGCVSFWRCRDNHMCIRAAETKGANATDALASRSLRPRGERSGHMHGGVGPIDMGIGRVQMQMGWDLPMLEGQNQFHQPSHTSCHLQMAHIGLHRADIEGLGSSGKDRSQRADFNRVTKRGTGAVRFDITDLIWPQIGIGQRSANHPCLGWAVRHRQPAAGTILVDRTAPNHGEDRVAAGFCIG